MEMVVTKDVMNLEILDIWGRGPNYLTPDFSFYKNFWDPFHNSEALFGLAKPLFTFPEALRQDPAHLSARLPASTQTASPPSDTAHF